MMSKEQKVKKLVVEADFYSDRGDNYGPILEGVPKPVEITEAWARDLIVKTMDEDNDGWRDEGDTIESIRVIGDGKVLMQFDNVSVPPR